MATLSQMGIPGIGNGALHPKLSNRYRVFFINMGGGQGNANDLALQCVSFNRPSLQREEIALHRYNSTMYIAGKHSWEPLNIVVEDDITNRASTIIDLQEELQQKLIGADGPWLASASSASVYKFGIKLEQLDGGETVLERWIYEGCWLTNTNYNEMGYGDSTIMNINLSIRFDHARHELVSNALGTAMGGNVNS